MSEVAESFPVGHPLAGFEDQIDQLRECGRLFHSRGWSVGTSSNYSVVIPGDSVELIVTASGKDKGRLKRGDFVRLDQEGCPTQADQLKSSAETMLHVVLAAEPVSAGSILHTHSVWGTLLSDHFYDQGGFEIEGFEMLKGLEGTATHETEHWVPIFDNTQDIPSLAREVQAMIESQPEKISHGFLIRKHGLYTWGRDVFASRRHIEVYEFLFECVGRKLGL
ncbi:methylthioribulose 1-phosphate dehydratase [Mariniblastus fucicola]|uniref:Methylthioribulose-1-phosphate dehydratase n=1 Tax=Mariniblastus fucicola TaxID=980251 RepID=A0A5B9PQN2_9BACT|nr:methylthioribulose 1-phosphate dehydratase [Mariniblastus fucicola]QEG24623.1 Methylthioribulose-1-phosphate dehydratase [Mariniblastus fucicola]